MKTRLALVAFVGLAALAGCHNNKDNRADATTRDAAPAATARSSGATTTTVANKPVNQMCAVMLNEEADPSVTTTYKGQTVGFCCPGCVKKWNNMSDAQKDAQLAKAMAK